MICGLPSGAATSERKVVARSVRLVPAQPASSRANKSEQRKRSRRMDCRCIGIEMSGSRSSLPLLVCGSSSSVHLDEVPGEIVCFQISERDFDIVISSDQKEIGDGSTGGAQHRS